MNVEEKALIKEKIIEYIASLENEIEELQEKIKPIAPDCSLGDLTRFEMMHEQDIFHKALYNSQIRLNRLKYILKTIDANEDYGICDACADDISVERLLLLPESAYCIACASKIKH
ncbi:TraR/DksA C4-type zinc finger protein [bacterium]|nr:TraR/DksA C4-type zinc finger protein [bacterium]MBU1884356.1 TraR/DksA C4-type zinc finger protein [bacterium]